jgi:hypothetical protein
VTDALVHGKLIEFSGCARKTEGVCPRCDTSLCPKQDGGLCPRVCAPESEN